MSPAEESIPNIHFKDQRPPELPTDAVRDDTSVVGNENDGEHEDVNSMEESKQILAANDLGKTEKDAAQDTVDREDMTENGLLEDGEPTQETADMRNSAEKDLTAASVSLLIATTDLPSERLSPVLRGRLSSDLHGTRDSTSSLSKSHLSGAGVDANTRLAPDHPQTVDSLEKSPTRSDIGFDEKNFLSEDERDGTPRLEIQSIMDQFGEGGQGPGHEEVMSPRLEFAGPLLGGPIHHPPRKSSLEPINTSGITEIQTARDFRRTSDSHDGMGEEDSDIGPAVPPKPSSIYSFKSGTRQDDRSSIIESPILSSAIHRPPPPEPEPEPALPFDFHRFLEQLRHRTADPVAKFLRSFLQEFGKKQWMVHEQVKIISDFLSFITLKMGQCEVWRDLSDAEFDNAREGMEKLVMNRLYTQTFSPAIPPPQPIPGARPRRKGAERPMGPGRRGQHQEDIERDDILVQKISIYGWIKEEHLEIPATAESGKKFLVLAQQELLKIKAYRAPRDKIICVLNCCKVIFGLLRHSKIDSSADSFMPLLIYVVLQANPEHLVSNVQYILRFRNQEKLSGEAGYYLSSLLGAVQFIENLDRTSLTISDEDFEKYVEAAVSVIAEKNREKVASTSPASQHPNVEASADIEHSPRQPTYTEPSTSQKFIVRGESGPGERVDEKDAVTGLLRTIQRPLSSIGRIFSEEGAGNTSSKHTSDPAPNDALRPSSGLDTTPARSRSRSRMRDPGVATVENSFSEDSAARQASVEAAEAHRLQQREHVNVVETLAGMFPDLDKDIISDVVTQKEGRVGLAVDACLALSS